MRTQSGFTLVEMLISALIMTFVSTCMLGVIIATYKTSAKVTNITDTASAVRLVKERLGSDVREGRTMGDVYGTGTTSQGIWIPSGVAGFPGSQNPVYGNNQAPPSGWPVTWTGGGVNNPYQLNATCLIVQIPILDNHNDSGTTHATVSPPTKYGWPTAIYPTSYGSGYPGPGNPAVTNVWDNVETHVYQVLPDPSGDGTYRMEYMCFPGYPVSGYLPAAHSFGTPEVLLKGIVGPKDVNGNLKVFQYIDKTDKSGTPVDTPDPNKIADYTGVICNLEVKEHTDSNTKRKDISIQPIGFKTEVFLRNNAIATTNGGSAP